MNFLEDNLKFMCLDVLDHTICLQNQKTGERFKEISLHEGLEKKNSLPFDGNFNDKEITERHKNWVLNLCNQEAPIKFSSVFQYSRKKWTKIGEGVYGEVFMKTYRTRSVVIKIIPIEGDLIVNGEKQKTYKDVITEIITAQQLHDLRSCVKNEATTFNELVKVNCIYGEYPSHLVKHWDLYHEVKGSENDSPVVFDGKQHYIALQMGYGGVDLESFKFASFEQIQSVFIQIALALAAAEAQLQFEHRDLHWGNVLVQKCQQKTISYKLEGKRYDLEDCSLQATIIDFTLSRITHDGMVLFNDLSKDPDLFEAEGDYQFDIYRMMRDHNGNDWKKFSPYTNVLWLHYLLTKMTTDMIFSSEPHQSDMDYLNWLQSAKYKILKFASASMFAKTYFKHLVP